MQRPKPNLTENKLLMLYSLDKLGGVTNDQAIRFFLENELMDYIDIQLSLAELTDGNLLQATQEPLGRTYALTGFGRDAIGFFAYLVPISRRSAVDELAPRWREVFMRETQVFASYDKALNGDIMVRLAARDRGVLVFEMNISVASHDEAELLCRRWRRDSAKVYAQVIRTLTAEDAPAGTGENADAD